MAFVPTPNTVRVIFQFAYGESIVEVTIAVTKSTPWTPADFDDLMPAMKDWWNFEMQPLQSGGIALTEIKATDVSSSTGAVRVLPVSPPEAGTGDTNVLPSNAAYVTTFATPLRGRSYRGRAYLPGIPRNMYLPPQHVDTTWASLVAAAWSSVNSYLVGGMKHAVISLRNAGVPRTTGVATEVTAYGGDTALDSQRRRLAGRGM